MTTGQWFSLGIVALLFWCTGCATLPTRPEIPLGEWSGTGTYVVEKWSADKDDPKSAVFEGREHGTYPTSLKIEPTTVAGEDAVRLEILSERGVFRLHPDIGSRTHLVMHLVKDDSVDENGIGLYHLAAAGLTIDDDPPEMEQGSSKINMVTCNTLDRDIVLRIIYQDGWLDVIHFQDNDVYKNGAYFQMSGGYIQWSELLHRHR